MEYNKWKDPEWLRWYRRENKRKHVPIKRHPYIMDDGTKWSDHHPYGKFNTREEKALNDRKYRKYIDRTTCDICMKSYNTLKKDAHESTKHHKTAAVLLAHYCGNQLDKL